MTKISEIVKKYRNQLGNGKPMPLRQFADLLSEVSENTRVSHATIALWESGTTPQLGTLILLHEFASDWRRDFATECLDTLIAQWKPSQPPTPLAEQPDPAQKASKR